MTVTAEETYANIKYRPQWAPLAVVTWAAVYMLPGVLLGRYASMWAGLGLMLAGAVPLAIFAWRCQHPRRLVTDRDGFRVEGRGGRGLRLGYDKIHEARWEAVDARWRRRLGPLVFLEPVWPLQAPGGMRLTVVHAGYPLVMDSSEIDGLERFVDTLRKHNVRGIGADSRRKPSAGGLIERAL